MKKILLVTILSVMFSLILFSGGFNTEAAMPPAQGGTTEVKGNVEEVDSKTLKADTLQDGLNEGNNLIWEDSTGYKAIIFPSGTGYIAGATAYYKVYPNINATLISKRAAYLEAYYMAQVNMLQGMQEYYTERKEEFKRLHATIVDGNNNDDMLFKINTESINQITKGLLGAFVTYDVKDQTEENVGTAYVSIAISPNTIRAAKQITNGIVFSNDLESTLNCIFMDIQNGVTPPIGGKIILIPETDMMAFVAFGSAIVRHSENKMLALENKKTATQVAKMRATQSMVDLLQGKEIIYSEGLNLGTTQVTRTGEFSEANEKVREYTEKNKEYNMEAAKKASTEILDVLVKTSSYKAVSAGNVPSGTMVQTAIEKSVETEGYGWVYAVAVYYPELSLDGEALYQKLTDTSYELPVPTAENNVNNTNDTETEEKNNLSENPQGPSGQVSDDGNL